MSSADSALKPTEILWAIADPSGLINHTTLMCRDQDAIAEWMKQEQTLTRIFRPGPVPSWEGYEAEGYRAVRCRVVPELNQPNVLADVAQRWRMRADELRSEAKTLKLNARWQGRKRRFLAAQLDSLAKELDLLTVAATVQQPQENVADEPRLTPKKGL